MILTAKRAEQSLRGHGRASKRDEGVALGVHTRMAWGPRLRAAIALGGPLLPTLPDTEAGPHGPQSVQLLRTCPRRPLSRIAAELLAAGHHITECKDSTLEVAARTNGSRRAQARIINSYHHQHDTTVHN